MKVLILAFFLEHLHANSFLDIYIRVGQGGGTVRTFVPACK